MRSWKSNTSRPATTRRQPRATIAWNDPDIGVTWPVGRTDPVRPRSAGNPLRGLRPAADLPVPEMRVGFDARALVSPAAGVRRCRASYSARWRARWGGSRRRRNSAGADLPAGVTGAAGVASAADERRVDDQRVAARGAVRPARHVPRTVLYGAVRRTSPLVLTIHDISYERHPEWYPYRRDPVRRAFYRWSARTADRVITDSQFSKLEIAAGYGSIRSGSPSWL